MDCFSGHSMNCVENAWSHVIEMSCNFTSHFHMLRIKRHLRAPPGHSQRWRQSQTANFTLPALNTATSHSSKLKFNTDTGKSGEETPKYKPGWFSRNPGVTLGGILLGIGLYIYRGSRGKKNFEKLQDKIAEAAVISPYEAWELRSSNNITCKTFEDVRDGVKKAFPSSKASIQHFDQYLSYKLTQVCPTGVSKGYHLERVLLCLEMDGDQKSDVDAQMVAFSMAVKGTVDERLRMLFNLATDAPPGEALSSCEEMEESNTREIPSEKLERLLHLLLNTYQIPSEKRVLAKEDVKYPFQEYIVATPTNMLKAAVEAQIKDKKIAEKEGRNRQSYTFEDFSQIMRGNTVCIWGECFSNSKKKMKN